MPSINLSGLRNISRLKALLAEGQPIDLYSRSRRIGRIIPKNILTDKDAAKSQPLEPGPPSHNGQSSSSAR